MGNSEILKQLNEIFIDILDNKDIVLVSETTANDVEEWDSLTHVQIVVALEKYFKVRFTSQEIRNWATAGEMVECISTKLKSA